MKHFNSILRRIDPSATKTRNKYAIPTTEQPNAWIRQHIYVNQWLCFVPDTYIKDQFNLYGLQNMDRYQAAIDVIKDDRIDPDVEIPASQLQNICSNLYAQIHQRFILTPQGMTMMRRKFEAGVFGTCPRYQCQGQHMLPLGLSPNPGESKAVCFCPRCRDLYSARTDVDGANFGPYFPHCFLQMNKDLCSIPKSERIEFSICGIPVKEKSELDKLRVHR